MSGNTRHYEAFADEVSKKILHPLAMKSTFPGYPTDKSIAALNRIVTTYKWDRGRQQLLPDKGLPGATTLFPSTNLFTSLDDLVVYSNALDRNTLLTSENYKKLTTPFITTGGRTNPYGLGWSTQRVGDLDVHWHYGYGDSYAALIIRVPQQKKAFILLSNSVAASEPFFLGYGNLLNSPFAFAFFKHVIFRLDGQFSFEETINTKTRVTDPVTYDDIFSQALMRYYTEQTYNGPKDEAKALLEYLAQNDPARFQKTDGSLIYLLAKLGEQGLKGQMETAIEAYASTGYFHPEIHESIARWYETMGNGEASRSWYHKLADSKWYGEQGPVRNACTVLGKYYLALGETEKGRSYLWREALYAPDDAAQQVKNMKPGK